VLDGVFRENMFGVFRTNFDVGDKTGVLGDRGDLIERLEIKDLLD
jgi:hypothetical protein